MFEWMKNGEKPPDLAPPPTPNIDLEGFVFSPAADDSETEEIEAKEVIGSSRDRFKSLFARARIPFVPRNVKMEARLRRDLEKQCMSEIIKESLSEDVSEEDLLIRIQNKSSPKPVAMQIGDNEIINLESILGGDSIVTETGLKQQEVFNGTVEEEKMVDGKISDCKDEDEQGTETVWVNREPAGDDTTPMDAGSGIYEKFEEDECAESMKYIWVTKENSKSGDKENSLNFRGFKPR